MSSTIEEQELPFVAPCKSLSMTAPFRWIKLGWHDLKAAPKQSLTYGLFIFLVSLAICIVGFVWGSAYSLFALLSGFIFVAPVIAIGLYAISRQLQLGKQAKLIASLREGQRHKYNEVLFSIMLLVVFLVWARAAAMVHIFFPDNLEDGWQDLAVFLSVGTLVGAFFSAVIFTASAFSLPMIIDRKVDMVTAVVTSINAVLRNKKTMIVWAAIIVGCVALSFATLLLGIIVLLPLLGHATWHGYQETIDARQFPSHD